MSKGKFKKSKNNSRRAGSTKRDDGSAEIRRAEKRLSKALAGVDEAREKVQRRERGLAKLMERHGRTAPVSAASHDAIPLEAPSQTASESGATRADTEPAEAEPAQAEPVEQAASTDGDEHHE